MSDEIEYHISPEARNKIYRDYIWSPHHPDINSMDDFMQTAMRLYIEHGITELTNKDLS